MASKSTSSRSSSMSTSSKTSTSSFSKSDQNVVNQMKSVGINPTYQTYTGQSQLTQPRLTQAQKNIAATGSATTPSTGNIKNVSPGTDWRISGTIASAKQNAPQPEIQKQIPVFDMSAYQQQTNDYINQIYDQQKQAQLAQLYASRDKAVGQLNQQKAELAPQYADKRNQSDVVNEQNVQRLREMMANSGLTSSGENVSATVGLQNARQSALNGLNLQEQQNNNDINRQINDLNNPANEQALTASLEAQKTQSLLDSYNKSTDRSYQSSQDSFNNALNLAGLTGKYNGQNTLAMNQYLDNKTMNEANLTGQYNGKNTLAYTQMLADLTGKYKGKDTIAIQQANNQLALQKQQFKSQQDWQKYVFNNMSSTDKAQLDWAKSQYGQSQAYDYFALKSNLESQSAMNKAQIDALNKSGFNDSQGGGGTKEYQANLKTAQNTYKIPDSAVPYINYIIKHESSFNPNAKNPNSSAHGYGQFIDSTAKSYEKKYGVSYSNPANQIYLTYRYMIDRYGSPDKAVAFWQANHWY